jgi:hypothetical protein
MHKEMAGAAYAIMLHPHGIFPKVINKIKMG